MTKRLLTATQYAKTAGMSRERVHQFLRAGRVPGAQKIGPGRGLWVIPEGAIVRRKKLVNGRWK